jgi:predicted secreted protein
MAQTTNFINGTDLKLFVDTVEVGYLTSITVSSDADTLDTASQSSGKYRTNIMGRMGSTVSFDGLHRFDATEGFQQFFADMKAGTSCTVKVSNENAGDYEFSATANITSIELSISDNEVVSFSGEFLVTGEPTWTVIV